MADQAVSSATNLVLGVVVARSLDIAEFGAFGLVWVTFGVIINVSRGLATDPLTVRFSGAPDERWRTAVGHATSTATSLGLLMGAMCVVAGLAMGGLVGSCFLALGCTLPGLLLQDSWRYAFFAAGRGDKALLNDAFWALCLIPTMIVAVTFGTAFGFVLAWGGAAASAAVFGCFQTRLLPRRGNVARWLRGHRDLGVRYTIENVMVAASAPAWMAGLNVFAGLAAVGAVRGAQLCLAPFAALRMGVSLIAVPEAARVLQQWPHRFRGFCLTLGCAQAVLGLLWGCVLVFLPSTAGEFILGPLWSSVVPLIVPATLAVVMGSVYEGAAVGLRALGASRRSMPLQVIRAAVTVLGGVVGAFVGGAEGGLWGTTVAATLMVVVVWRQFSLAFRSWS